ncbi:MAG: pyridoxal kinase, partial [Clostridia bacterium]|nr:pyridoxal kinase [Clostridia bacterium]
DIFASALIGAYMRGKDIFDSADITLEFTCAAIKRTHDAATDTRFGVNFEQGIGDFIKKLGG